FANEVGLLAKSLGVDARRVANVFCADTKLNISAKYLRPGFSFGGSCLPKDLRAILREAALRSVRVPMLEATLSSNAQQIDALVAGRRDPSNGHRLHPRTRSHAARLRRRRLVM